ncbi:MAG: PAS domain-containing sensor histidine kinase [Candidatus Lokiarchaeota archaeon]|nr:PAS domain-containing sensor histidine kinase [Candidatus Lokiarchaeota archaeon]
MPIEPERNEKKLEGSEEKYKLILDNANDLITIINEKFIHEYLNEKTYFELLGYSEEDIIGRTPLVPLHPDDQKKAIKILKDGFKYGKGHNEMRVRHKDGHYLWLENKGTTFIDIDGQKKAFIISRDITERKNTERQLKESEELFRTIAEQSSMGILIVQDDQIKYVNDTFLKIFEYSYEEITSWSKDDLVKLIHPEDLPILREQREQRRSGNLNIKPYSSYRVVTKSGIEKWIDQFSKDILYKGKDAELATIIDISEKKETERLIVEENKKLLELSQIRRDLISRVSHELKTPLSSIYAASQFLLQEFREQLEGSPIKFIEMIHKSGQKLKQLIEDLLDMSIVESGKLKLGLQNEDLGELIKECMNDIEYRANVRKIRVRFDHLNPIFLEIDKLRIEQVIINLLSNSIKFTPTGGAIYIELTEDDKWIEISIRDTGVGLTKKEQKMLFQKFGKIERKGKKFDIDSEGSGLGLYISKEIVELHKGMILVDSKGRNKGATFIIKLPKT